jgi:hypothetical protein
MVCKKPHLDGISAQKSHFSAKAVFGLEVGANAAFRRKSGIWTWGWRKCGISAQKRHFGTKAAFGLEVGAKAAFGLEVVAKA